MANFIFDFLLVGFLIIASTALLGVITNGIGTHIFGRFHRFDYVDQSDRSTKNFKLVGGKKDT